LVDRGEYSAIYVGNLYPGKGIEMICALALQLPNVRFDVVGGDSGAVRSLRKNAEATPNLRFHGHVPHARVGQYLAGADVALAPFGSCVLSSKGEDIARWMSPLKMFEYMAAGKAIVASDLPVLREVVTHGENVILCPPGNLASWKDAILELGADDRLRHCLGSNARRLLESQYTWERRAERVLSGFS
jgi:glycosyltransferase involved in cell wall biosynthesis